MLKNYFLATSIAMKWQNNLVLAQPLHLKKFIQNHWSNLEVMGDNEKLFAMETSFIIPQAESDWDHYFSMSALNRLS